LHFLPFLQKFDIHTNKRGDRMKTSLCLCICLGLLPACAPAQEKVDEAALLMKLDRDFDTAAAEKGVDGWVEYFAPNGSMLSDTSAPTTGPSAIRAEMEPVFKDSTFSLRWHPTKAELMIPGVIGYTVGRWERSRKNKEGTWMKSTGTYSTTWKKQPDGSWKIVLDSGVSDGPPVESK
jgi:ketosteroid isomerase-like protein